MALPISTVVDINAGIQAGGVLRTEYGTGLLVTQDAALPAGGSGKAQVFKDIDAVNAVFSAGAALSGAQVWFGQDPPPKSLYIGRWAPADVSTTLRGGTMVGSVASMAVAGASFRYNDEDYAIDMSGGSFTTYAAIATALESAIAGNVSGTTVVYGTDGRLLLTLTSAQDLGYLETHSGGTGTDISGLLAMRADSPGVDYKPGHDAESLVDGVGEMLRLASGTTPVALMLAGDIPETYGAGDANDTRDELAAFAQAGDYVMGLRDTAAQALATNDATSKTALVFSRQQSHVNAVYTKAGQYPDIGMLALLSAQNLNQPASIITTHLKALSNVEATDITQTQLLELERKRANVYTTIAGLPSLYGGFSGKAGNWADAVWWLLWLKNEVELKIFNAQRASRRFNTAILRDTLGQCMRVAERSGGIQRGGRVNAALAEDIRQVTGNQAFDGTLPNGYTIWIETPSVRSDLDRENRVGRFRVWVSPSDAIHKVVGSIVLAGG